MPTTKMRPCCAKFVGRISAEEANLARLARLAARRSQKNLDLTSAKAAIARQKVALAQAKQNVIDHEAGHAGEIA